MFPNIAQHCVISFMIMIPPPPPPPPGAGGGGRGGGPQHLVLVLVVLVVEVAEEVDGVEQAGIGGGRGMRDDIGNR